MKPPKSHPPKMKHQNVVFITWIFLWFYVLHFYEACTILRTAPSELDNVRKREIRGLKLETLIQSLTESYIGFAIHGNRKIPVKKSSLLSFSSPAKIPIIKAMFLDVDSVNQNALTSTHGEKVIFRCVLQRKLKFISNKYTRKEHEYIYNWVGIKRKEYSHDVFKNWKLSVRNLLK